MRILTIIQTKALTTVHDIVKKTTLVVLFLYLSSSIYGQSFLDIDSEGDGGHRYSLVATTSANTNGVSGFFGIKDQTVVPTVGDLGAWRFMIDTIGNIGIATLAPKAKLQVSEGDIYIEDIGKGVIMKSPNGQCWRYVPDNSGQLVGTTIVCP